MAKKGQQKLLIPPTIDEVKVFFKEKGYKESVAIRFFEGYDCNSWLDSNNNKVCNWRMKAWQVWFTEENKEIKYDLNLANKQALKPLQTHAPIDYEAYKAYSLKKDITKKTLKERFGT